jgi:ferric-dicitrate binding protein FerR (iron transport regulator)
MSKAIQVKTGADVRTLATIEKDALSAALVAQGKDRHSSVKAWRIWRQAQSARRAALQLLNELWDCFDANVQAGEFTRAHENLCEIADLNLIG